MSSNTLYMTILKVGNPDSDIRIFLAFWAKVFWDCADKESVGGEGDVDGQKHSLTRGQSW